MRSTTLALLFCVLIPVVSEAQQSAPAVDTSGALDVGNSEWMATAGPGFSVALFHSAVGHRYALQTLSWGRVLTRPHGPSVLRGRFEWAVEVVPVFGQFEPSRTYGFGVTPLLWRWNFERRGKIAPFTELAGGGLWTTDPVPARTSTSNFTGHAGFGLRYFLLPHQALVLGYRFHHISNGNRLEQNPGINAHVVQFGWSYFQSPQRRRGPQAAPASSSTTP